MNIQDLSTTYIVKRIENTDIDAVLALYTSNPLYFEHCPPFPNKQSVKDDLLALPAGKNINSKYYLGFWDNQKLVAVADIITEYPNDDYVFIGLFMLAKDYQGKGKGTAIISECLAAFKSFGYKYARLGYVKTNLQAEAFWLKNGFAPTGTECVQPLYTVVVAEKTL